MNKNIFLLIFLILFEAGDIRSQPAINNHLIFELSAEQPASKDFTVTFWYDAAAPDSIVFRMPAWTPGYYQMMHYADKLSEFSVIATDGDSIRWKKSGRNAWKIYPEAAGRFLVKYKVRADRNFVGASYLDSVKGFVSPAGLFLHPEHGIHQKVFVRIRSFNGWTVATGLEAVKGTENLFEASDFDILYDSPILMGSQLESFPSFRVEGKPHYFIAHNPGEFPRQEFMNDLSRIITTASDIIGEIPYNHYTFLGIGPGGGGIEHLNSTAISFHVRNGNAKRYYSFLAHEYFHHYNAKRIRPIELGPFDYDRGSRTKMLWIAEGITSYYEHIILRRAGFTSVDELLSSLRKNIAAYESRPGKKLQSVAMASYNTWEDGPFGGNKDSTISYYEKGPILAALLDFKIRHETGNKKSLDDLMRTFYYEYYKKKQRGFTEEEFRMEAEKAAGTSLAEFFGYIYTVTPIDYKKYFSYAGLDIEVPDGKPEEITINPKKEMNSLQSQIFQTWTAVGSN